MRTRFSIPVLVVCLASACSQQELRPPVVSECRNDELTSFAGLLIVAPHPDDEILGFAGLSNAFVEQGKPVRTVVVTDGDAYCAACALWTTGSVDGRPCDALTLSNLATAEVDSLAETRRAESTAAAAALGRPAPEFLAYPDTGLGAALTNLEAGNPDTQLRRSDFSACTSCGECGDGYGAGPETGLSARTLIASLDRLLDETTPDTLVATTHWLDGHADHAALGTFVNDRVAGRTDNRTVAFAVIHAHTSNAHASADCWYPGPSADPCPCFDEERADSDPDWLTSLRTQRERPDWPQALPGDVNYGEPTQFCVGDALRSTKAQAIDAFGTQLGTAGRVPGILPESRKGMLDCSAYLRSFGRQTEVFVVKRYATDAAP